MRNISTKLVSALLLCASAAVFASSNDAAVVSTSGKSTPRLSPTFFRPRNISTDSTFELALENWNMFHSPCQQWGEVYARPFYQRSFNTSDLASYFLPRGQQALVVGPNDYDQVDPLWLRLVGFGPVDPLTPLIPRNTQYRTDVKFAPARETYGAVFTLNFFPCERFFLNVNLAVVRANHSLFNVMRSNDNDPLIVENATMLGDPIIMGQDTVLADNQFGFASFCTAMNAADMTAAKIPCTSTSATGVDDVQFKLGYNFVNADHGHFMAYFVATAPTGRSRHWKTVAPAATAAPVVAPVDGVQPTQGAEFLFQPVVGSRQASFGGGVNADVLLYCQDDRSMWWMMDAKVNYYINATERRTFDLNNSVDPRLNGEWTRYLLLQPNTAGVIPTVGAPAATQIQLGANVFTMDAKVRPGLQFQYWTGVHFNYCNWQLEAGYNFWLRQQERVQILANADFPPATGAGALGILDAYPIDGLTFVSASNSTIFAADEANSDAVFVPVVIADLNPTSAAHPRTHSSKFFGSAAYNYDFSDCFAGHIGLNGSLEFAHNNAALSQGAVWLTAGLLF